MNATYECKDSIDILNIEEKIFNWKRDKKNSKWPYEAICTDYTCSQVIQWKCCIREHICIQIFFSIPV